MAKLSSDIFPGTKKATRREWQERQGTPGEEWEAFPFHHTLLIIPLHLLFSRRALRPKPIKPSPRLSHPRGMEPVSFPRRERKEEKPKGRAEVASPLFEGAGRRDRFCTEAQLGPGAGSCVLGARKH